MKKSVLSLAVLVFTFVTNTAFSSNNVDCPKKIGGGLKSQGNYSRFLPQDTGATTTQQSPQGIVK
jgi:hypothetical protein